MRPVDGSVIMRCFGISVALLLAVAACSVSSIAKEDLARVVVRDGVPFDVNQVPAEVIDHTLQFFAEHPLP